MYEDMMSSIEFVEERDPAIGAAMGRELKRQRRNIELIASENIVSPAVLAAMGSVLTNKYAEGYPGNRYYGGCEFVDEVESIAIERAKELFGAEYANVQPHAGVQANMAVYYAVLKPGDTVLGMSLDCGGHLSHGSPANMSGILYNFIPYGLDEKTEMLDYDGIRDLALKHRPKLIVAGASAYPRIIDFKRLREIADEAGSLLMIDMAHISGLIAGGAHPSPIPYCDFATTTTHKTLRGPRGGLILARKEFAKKIDKAIFPGSQGGPLEHVIAAKAICFGEALKPEFKEYAHQIVKNCKALAGYLQDRGFRLVSGGTDNHLVLVDLRNFHITGMELQNRLDEVQITLNRNAIPNDPESHNITSGVRIGTPAVTTRGFKEEDMKEIAECVYLACTDFEAKKEEMRARVSALTEKYPIYA